VRRGQFLEAVADDEDAAVPFGRARARRRRQRHQRHRQGGPHRAPQQSHRQLSSALGRRIRLAPLLAAALALALALPACGSESSAATEPSAASTTAPDPGPSLTTAEKGTARTACASGLDGFLSELEHLRRSLVIGVSYEQYVAELATVRRSYRRVPVANLDLACVAGAAAGAERSFDGYLAAANAWGDCVSEAGCETASLEPRLQHEWRLAAKQLAAAKRRLTPADR
jgi:hypothetical protein